MLMVEKIGANNKKRIINLLRSNIIKHVFAFHDIQHEPEHTTMYAAFEDGTLKGYILIYTALNFPSVILESGRDIAEKLIEYAPENHFIMHTPTNLLPIVHRKFPHGTHYVENWMIVRKDEANFFKSELVCRLCTDDDSSDLAMLLSSRKDRPTSTVEKYVELISKQPIYGVFVDGKLVSYAGSFIQLPQVWMIGGVYSHPEYRSKGYATLTTSAVTEEALENAEAAALFVRMDNYSATRVYEKIGYKKIGEKLWIDVGTGMKP